MTPELRITITDASTVYTGATNLHRYDAPSALDVATSVRNVFGPRPQGSRVHVAASADRLRQIQAALADYDVALSLEELPSPDLPEQDGGRDGGEDSAQDSRQDLGLRRPRHAADDGGRGIHWVMVALVLLVVAACAVVVVVTARSFGGSTAATEAAPPPKTSASPSPVTTTPTKAEAPANVTLEQAGVTVVLPEGFTLHPDGDMWRATGLDPDFRLKIAVEELYNLPAETMAEQLTRDVEADPETELVETDGHALTYREIPGDGSEVLWKTWPHDNHQVFIGCHTRTAPTAVQQATCRMAMDSAVFDPEKFSAWKSENQQVNDGGGGVAVGG